MEEKEDKKNESVNAIIAAVALGALGWYFFGGGMDMQVQKDMQKIHDQVAKDAEAQYRIADRSGNALDACVQAGLVSAAYLQAKNEGEYQHWKAIEDLKCAQAGIR